MLILAIFLFKFSIAQENNWFQSFYDANLSVSFNGKFNLNQKLLSNGFPAINKLHYSFGIGHNLIIGKFYFNPNISFTQQFQKNNLFQTYFYNLDCDFSILFKVKELSGFKLYFGVSNVISNNIVNLIKDNNNIDFDNLASTFSAFNSRIHIQQYLTGPKLKFNFFEPLDFWTIDVSCTYGFFKNSWSNSFGNEQNTPSENLFKVVISSSFDFYKRLNN